MRNAGTLPSVFICVWNVH